MVRSLAALLLAAALLAGCGSSKKSNTSSSTTPASGGGGGGTAVSMKNIQFSPKSVTVKVGQTVTWTNDDSVDHNVTASDGTFKSSSFGHGATFKWKATKAGTFKYTCTIHPGMDGTITVTG
jgi:plastocyanin